ARPAARTEAHADRRAVDRPVAAAGEGDLRHPAGPARKRRLDPDGRAERQARARDLGLRRGPRAGPHAHRSRRRREPRGPPRGAAFPRRSYRRILTVEQPELVIDIRIAAPRLARGFEERLADHREELRGVLGRIGIEPGVLAALYRVAKAL